MCVGHGLVSVNAKKHLIGHHMDWARGFPFEAFGLPDQYARAPPSVALFGFGYDDDFLKVMGEPWPGVREAERRPGRRSRADQGKTVEEVRRERQALFDRVGRPSRPKDQDTMSPKRETRDRGPPRPPAGIPGRNLCRSGG